MFRVSWKKVAPTAGVATATGLLAYSKINSEEPALQASGNHNYSRRLYPASAEFPEVAKNRNIMSRNLTQGLYARLCDKRTANGFTLDDAIQPGVDNIGKFSWTGIIAGDGESYDTFAELFNKIIAEKHGFSSTQRHVTDWNNKGSTTIPAFSDPSCVLSIRLRTLRNVRGYSFPSFCTRGERRDVESILVKSLYKIGGGVYYGLQNLSDKEEVALTKTGFWMERPFYPQDLSANFARDWPDARGIWLSDDRSLTANLNRRDHLLVSLCEKSSDMPAGFAKFASFVQKVESNVKEGKWEMNRHNRLGYLTSDPKNLGTALKLSVRVRLPKLSKDPRLATLLKMVKLSQHFKVMEDPDQDQSKEDSKDEVPNAPSTVVEISSSLTLGKSEVEITQMFVESINKLIDAEKLLEAGQTLDAVLYN